MKTEAIQDIQSFDKQPQEGNKAYSAFAVYRDMGRARSFLKAYRTHSGYIQAAHVSGTWRLWAEKYNWTGRVLAFDAYRELQSRKSMEDAYTKELEAYRKQLTDLAGATLAAATGILSKALQRLQALDAQEISIALIPSYVRAGAAIAEAAVNAKAIGLGVDDILKQMANEE